MIGSWAAAGDRKTRPVTLLEGMQARAPRGTSVAYAKGASYAFEDAGKSDGFAEAIALAQKSDVIIAAMGERWDMTGEAASRTSLDLPGNQQALRSEEHTSELQSLMRISYAVFCLKKKKHKHHSN